MEINISAYYDANPAMYSGSVAELGDNAGKITWNNAKESGYTLLDTADKLEAMRKWALSSGGWNDEEIAAWTDVELNALFIQLVFGDIREGNEDSIFTADDGQIYYSLEG